MSEHDSDLAEAIYADMCSEKTAAAALDLWQHRRLGPSDLWDMGTVLRAVTRHAIDVVLARRQSLAARDPSHQDAPCDERECCARAIEAMATAIRDHGPKTAEGLLTGLAGAQVGCLLDAAALLRLRQGPQEEDGYPGSLLPPGWPKRGAP